MGNYVYLKMYKGREENGATLVCTHGNFTTAVWMAPGWTVTCCVTTMKGVILSCFTVNESWTNINLKKKEKKRTMSQVALKRTPRPAKRRDSNLAPGSSWVMGLIGLWLMWSETSRPAQKHNPTCFLSALLNPQWQNVRWKKKSSTSHLITV